LDANRVDGVGDVMDSAPGEGSNDLEDGISLKISLTAVLVDGSTVATGSGRAGSTIIRVSVLVTVVTAVDSDGVTTFADAGAVLE
jgi:hypothetical protein